MSLRTQVSTSALILALSTTHVWADVTAEQVWGDWKSYMESFGYSMTATVSTSGDSITAGGITMNMELPDDEGTFDISLGNVTFTDVGDGTVSITMPEVTPMTFNVQPTKGDGVKGTLNITQASPSMIVSGDPDNMNYAYTAQSVAMSLADLVVEDEAMPPEMLDILVTFNGIANTTNMQAGDLRTYTQAMTVDSLDYDVSFLVPEGPEQGNGKITGQVQNLTANGTGAIPEGDMSNMGAMLANGFSSTGTFNYASGNANIDIVSPDGPVSIKSSSTGGAVNVSMNENGLGYDVSQANLAMDMQVASFPFPISLEMLKSSFNLKMPMVKSDEEQDFAFGFTMADFSVNDTIWNLFDPAGQLPRDPATLALDLTGKTKILLDFLNPEEAAKIDAGDAPAELNALTLNNLLVSAVGAKLSGEGAFTFDNTDLQTFNGLPKPNGAVDLRAEGANALIDTLVNMGLLPQEQAMGARMMMGLFTVAQGDDVLTSKIEVNEAGHLLANGQRLQ